MFVFVHYELYLKEKKYFEQLKDRSIVVFEISFSSKSQYKQELEKIRSLKTNVNAFTAVKITLEKIDNVVPGIVSALKREFDIVIGQGGLNKFNRFFIEQTQIDFLFNPHNTLQGKKFDFIHHPNIGMNQVLFEFAKEKKIAVFISMNNIEKRITSKETGRISYLIKLSRKFEIPLYFNFLLSSFSELKSLKELESIYSLFSYTFNDYKLAQSFVYKLLEENKEKKSSYFVDTGISYLKKEDF